MSLVPFPVIVWLVYRVRARLRRGFRQASVAWGDLTSVLADTIPGVRIVKAFAQEDREIERFGRSNRRVVDINDRVNVTWSFFKANRPIFYRYRLAHHFGLRLLASVPRRRNGRRADCVRGLYHAVFHAN